MKDFDLVGFQSAAVRDKIFEIGSAGIELQSALLMTVSIANERAKFLGC